jgi:hypothetical protein
VTPESRTTILAIVSVSQQSSLQQGTFKHLIFGFTSTNQERVNNMETLKVYPGVEKGSKEYYYQKFRMHDKREDYYRPFTYFYCRTTTGEDNFPCMHRYVTLNPGAPPQKYVSIFAYSGCEELSANQILAGLPNHLQ